MSSRKDAKSQNLLASLRLCEKIKYLFAARSQSEPVEDCGEGKYRVVWTTNLRRLYPLINLVMIPVCRAAGNQFA